MAELLASVAWVLTWLAAPTAAAAIVVTVETAAGMEGVHPRRQAQERRAIGEREA